MPNNIEPHNEIFLRDTTDALIISRLIAESVLGNAV